MQAQDGSAALKETRNTELLEDDAGAVRTYLIICDTLYAECRSIIPQNVQCDILPFKMHTYPDKLQQRLQESIDAVPGSGADILIGFGLCSHAAVNLSSERHRLIIPRVHDCIAMLCGSQQQYARLAEEELGTLYLTKRFIESEDGTYHICEFDAYAARYGEQLAAEYIGMVLHSYKRAVLMNTGEYEMDRYRSLAGDFCERYSLDFKEISATRSLLEKLVKKEWDGEFIRKNPGEKILLDDFLNDRV